MSSVKNGMKRISIVITIIFSSIATTLSGQEWKVFQSYEGDFSVMTPGMMEQKRATITTELGDFDVHTLFYNSQDTVSNYLYLINFYDLPEEMLPPDSTTLAMEFLLNTMDQSVSDLGGDLQYSTEVEIGNHPGLMWRSRSDEKVVKSRAYVINNRFYMLQVFSVPSKSLNADVDKFLESFTLKT